MEEYCIELLVREYRIKKGLTVQELSDLSGVSCDTIVAMENGSINELITDFYYVSKALNVNMSSLIREKGSH